MNQFPYLYPHSLSEAERLNEEELWQDNRDAEVSHTQLTEMFRHSDPAALMDEAEQAQLAELDDTVTVYRGVTTINSDNLLALSWTLDYETADWFARRFDEDGTVYKAQIDKEQKPAEEYLKQLKGKKHLIIGNHDRDWVKKCNLEDFFESVNNLHFISDGKRQMTLCHYPMMSWPHMTRCYMVFGHIHGNTDADYWPLIRENDLMLNAGADVNGFAPVTFEEMQENNYRHKAGWNPELCTMEADQ